MTIKSTNAELKKGPLGAELLVAGDLNVNLRESERSQGERDSNNSENSGSQGYMSPHPPVKMPMVLGRENVEHGPGGEGGDFLDGLHPRERLLSLSEYGRTGPTA